MKYHYKLHFQKNGKSSENLISWHVAKPLILASSLVLKLSSAEKHLLPFLLHARWNANVIAGAATGVQSHKVDAPKC